MHVKKNDTVRVISGSDKGKVGKVLKVFPKVDKVVVALVNLKKHHERPRKQGKKGQVIEREHPIHVSNVALGDKPVTVKKPKVVKAKKA